MISIHKPSHWSPIQKLPVSHRWIFLRTLICWGLLMILQSGASAGLRQTSIPHGGNSPLMHPNCELEGKWLHEAWNRLHSGLHDYNGFRAAAQQRTQLAAQMLGLQFVGFTRPRLTQAQSDALLVDARDILKRTLSSLLAKRENKAAAQVQAAIQLIQAALAVR